MSNLAQSGVSWIHFNASSICFDQTCLDSAESAPLHLYSCASAHLEACSLTSEQACSFLLNHSIWDATSPSFCYELSNDMLDHVLFVRVSNSSAIIFVSGECFKFVCARIKTPPTHKHRICDRQS